MSQIVHPLVPEIILSNARVGNHSGDFPAVGLFVDISGFSTMTDALMARGQHGAEVLAEIMRGVLDPVIESIFAQDGFVCSSAGDGLTALFPLDLSANARSAEHALAAAERALAAAFNIQARAAEHQVYETPYQDFRISIKVGMALGGVRWGIIMQLGKLPGSQRGVYFFSGTAVEGSVEAEHEARAGEIILDSELLALLGSRVEAEPAGKHYRVLRVTGDLPAPRTAYRPPVEAAEMAHFFPYPLVTQALSGEFRQVVNMFISLPTVTTETQLRIFLNSLFALQERWGGLLDRLDFGDKGTHLLMFWGAPTAHENDIERALSFILDLQTITSIPINAGITYRISHAGFIGGRLHEEYTCFGRGVNLAARFMTAAPRGEIWVDKQVAERAAGKFEIESVGERAFKGFSSPQKIFALYERKAESQPFFRGALAGREQELAMLRAFLASLESGQYAGMLVVTGEAGIGKSRLVFEAVQSIETEQPGRFQVFLAQTDEILRQPFNPFVYWLRRYLGVNEAQGEARSKRSFNRCLDDLVAALPDRGLAAELDRTRSFLGALVGLRWPDSLYEQLDAEARYQNTQIGLVTLLQAASLHAPVVLLLEDLHWIDGDSAALLARLMRVLSDPYGQAYPVAILGTSRVDPDLVVPEDSPLVRVALEGLALEPLRAMAASLLGAPPAGALLDVVARRAEGNPFFAEQILYYLRDQGFLALRDGFWQIEQVEIEGLPAGANALLVARLDHLAQQVRETVQVAAVLGREFEVRLLSAMFGSEVIPPEVSAAEREAIWTALSELRYLFKHALLREAAYQMQVHARRRDLHALAFETYQKLYADSLSGHYSELAYHAEQAGMQAEARSYLALAGKEAFERFQNQRADDYFTRALALTPESDPSGRYDLFQSRENINKRLSNYPDRLRDLQEIEGILPVLNDPVKEADFLLRMAEYYKGQAESPKATENAARAVDLALKIGQTKQAAAGFLLLGTFARYQGQYETAYQHDLRGLELARQAQATQEELNALNNLALLDMDRMHFETARDRLFEGLEVARREGFLQTEAVLLHNLGRVSGMQGDHEASQKYIMESLAIDQKIGYRTGEALANINLGYVLTMQGNYSKALFYLEHANRFLREVGDLFYQVYALINLSACLNILGEPAAAEERSRMGLALARKTGSRDGEAWTLTYLGHSLLAQAAYDPAAEAFSAALAIRMDLDQTSLAAEPSAGLARTAFKQGDTAGALKAIEPVLANLEGGGSLDGCDDPLRVYLTGYQVLRAAGDPRAAGLLETAYRQLQERAAKIRDAELRDSILNNVAHHREICEAWEALDQAG